MLVLDRTAEREVFINVPPSTEPTQIVVRVCEIRMWDRVCERIEDNPRYVLKVRLGFDAPRFVEIVRDDAAPKAKGKT